MGPFRLEKERNQTKTEFEELRAQMEQLSKQRGGEKSRQTEAQILEMQQKIGLLFTVATIIEFKLMS